MTITFTVFGQPQPAGSKRGFVITPKGGGRPRAIITDANPDSKAWQSMVADAGRAAYHGPLLDDYLKVTFRFYRPRPKGHFNTRGQLNAKGEREFAPGTKPDLLKLARGAEDALSGIIYRDDSLICREILEKAWGEPNRLEVEIEPLLMNGQRESPPMMLGLFNAG